MQSLFLIDLHKFYQNQLVITRLEVRVFMYENKVVVMYENKVVVIYEK